MLLLVRMDATWYSPHAHEQYAGSAQSFVMNLEPQETPKHESLMNVSGMREGEKKDGKGGEEEKERKKSIPAMTLPCILSIHIKILPLITFFASKYIFLYKKNEQLENKRGEMRGRGR